MTSKKVPTLRGGGNYTASDVKTYELGAVKEVAAVENGGSWDVVIMGEKKEWFLSLVFSAADGGGEKWVEDARKLERKSREGGGDGDFYGNVLGRSPEPKIDLSDV